LLPLWKERSLLEGRLVKQITPQGCCSSHIPYLQRKRTTVYNGLENDFWGSQINNQWGFNVDHLQQFYMLWEMLANVQLNNDAPNSIIWKFTNNGNYSAKSAYNMQFSGLITSTMTTLVWKPWAPRKCKIFYLVDPPKSSVDSGYA
jgi:hypothetical protein